MSDSLGGKWGWTSTSISSRTRRMHQQTWTKSQVDVDSAISTLHYSQYVHFHLTKQIKQHIPRNEKRFAHFFPHQKTWNKFSSSSCWRFGLFVSFLCRKGGSKTVERENMLHHACCCCSLMTVALTEIKSICGFLSFAVLRNVEC